MPDQRQSDKLSTEEVHRAIANLTPIEMARLLKTARVQAAKTMGAYTAKELLQESFTRAISGDRKWPRQLNALTFFAGRLGVMRSIASSELKQNQLQLVDDYSEDRIPDVALSLKSAESELTSNMLVSSIFSLFCDDAVAQKMLSAMMTGLRGEQLREKIGLEKTDFESKLRKIRRRIEKAQEDGKL